MVHFAAVKAGKVITGCMRYSFILILQWLGLSASAI
jgi:hypothetical protein